MGRRSMKTKGFFSTVGVILLILLLSQPVLALPLYRKPLPTLPITCNPKNFYDAYSTLVCTQVFDRLLDFDDLLNINPMLAERWESRDDGRIWRFILRKGVKFHNGQPFTAEDVAFSLKHLLDKNSVKRQDFAIIEGAEEYQKGRTKSVDGIKIIDPYTIEVWLKKPFTPFLAVFAAYNTEIVPNNYGGLTESEFSEKPIGTGAFKFDGYVKGKSVKLSANDEYFGGKPKINLLFERSDRKDAIDKFNQGYYHDIDWYYPEPHEIKRDYSVTKSPRAHTRIIAFNTRRMPLNNEHVRKAIDYVLDKHVLSEKCYHGYTVGAGYVPLGIGGYTSDIKVRELDINKAKDELSKAKLTRDILSKKLVIYRPDNYPCQDFFSDYISGNLKKIGLDVTVKHIPLGELFDKYYWNRDYDMLNLTYTADYPEAFFMLNVFKSDHSDNYTGVKDKEIDALLNNAITIKDRYERFKIYQKIQNIVYDKSLIICLNYDIFSSFFQRNVKGVLQTPLTSYMAPMRSIGIVDEEK